MKYIHPDPVRAGFGSRLAAARKMKNLSQTEVGDRLGYKKAAVSAWETGRGDPGVFVLRTQAKLYDVSSDSLLWEDALSPEAMKIAVEFDHMTDAQKRKLLVFWRAVVAVAVSDSEVELKMPITTELKPVIRQ